MGFLLPLLIRLSILSVLVSPIRLTPFMCVITSPTSTWNQCVYKNIFCLCDFIWLESLFHWSMDTYINFENRLTNSNSSLKEKKNLCRFYLSILGRHTGLGHPGDHSPALGQDHPHSEVRGGHKLMNLLLSQTELIDHKLINMCFVRNPTWGKCQETSSQLFLSRLKFLQDVKSTLSETEDISSSNSWHPR